MKKLILSISILVVFGLSLQAQDKNTSAATVEEISGIPMFLYASPVEKYEVVGKAGSFGDLIKLTAEVTATVNDKAKKLVSMSKARLEKGKTPPFDAIIVDVDHDKTQTIKFKNGKSLKANAQEVEGILVFFFSKPDTPYKKVTDLEPDFSIRASNGGMLYDKVLSMIKRTNKKVKGGELKKFDAIIFNPEDLSGTAIAFK
jgi:hypothetical protein